MSESETTKAYKQRRQERIDLAEYRKAVEAQEMRQELSKGLELQNSEKVRDDWQRWRQELLNGYRYAPFIKIFSQATRESMLSHIQERLLNEAMGPSRTELSFRLLLDLVESRNGFRYEKEDRKVSLLFRAKRAFNFFLLKLYIRTLDYKLMKVVPYRLNKN